MKTKVPLNLRTLTALLTLAAMVDLSNASAQTDAPTSSPPPGSEDTIQLNPFTVTASQTGRYTSSEATSGARVATNLFTSPESITVITREAFDDVNAARILDVAKYVSGISESTIPGGLDRITIRGFQVEGQTVDGFYSDAQANLDPVFVDRIEVVKGPNAILAPSGVPGGTVNAVTRKPQFRDFGSVSASWGEYDGWRAEFDDNRSFNLGTTPLAFRVVGEVSDNHDGWRNEWSHSAGVMPEILLQTKTGAQLLLQLQAYTWRAQNDFGAPVAPSAGTTTDSKLLTSDTLNTAGSDFRQERRLEARTLFTAPVTDQLSMRLAMRYTYWQHAFDQSLPSASFETADAAGVIKGNSGGGYDPRTGEYVPGQVFYTNPTTGAITTYTATPATLTYNRGGQYAPGVDELVDVQNDYAYKLNFDGAKFTTVGGFSYTYDKGAYGDNFITSKPAINYGAPSAGETVIGIRNQHATNSTSSEQLYLTETASLLDDKLAFNGAVTYYNTDLSNKDPYQKATATVANVDATLLSYGVVVTPIKTVAAYYSYNENASNTGAGQIAKGAPPLQWGKQHEFGIRFQSPDQKYYLTVAHFDIRQTNYSVPNPANLVVPPPSPLLPNLYSDRHAKGWEVEARAAVTSSLSLIGNWTNFTNRDTNNVPFRGTAETSAALLANYSWAKQTPLAGLEVGLGVDYRGRTPGDAASGYTSAPYLVPLQPSFYLDARTLVNLMVSYQFHKNLRAQLIVDNLLDEKYLQSSINRYNVSPGRSIDPQLRVTYSF